MGYGRLGGNKNVGDGNTMWDVGDWGIKSDLMCNMGCLNVRIYEYI